jgi:hypothetical protein
MRNANSIVSLEEIKSVAPSGFDPTDASFDNILVRLGIVLTRWVEKHTRRLFYPSIETRYFEGTGGEETYIDDLVSVTTIHYSDDDGENYTLVSADDYELLVGASRNPKESYTSVRLNKWSDLGTWPVGVDALKIAGTWNFTHDRDDQFQETGDSVQDAAGIGAADTEITVGDADALDLWGFQRFSRLNIIKIEDEWIEITAVDTATNKLTVIRGINGTTAAIHAKDEDIDKLVFDDDIKQAVIIQAIHQFKRGQSGFGDAQQIGDAGKILHIKAIDPEALSLMKPFRALQYGDY